MHAMSDELIWFNGETIPMSEARPGVEDRGSQFADGVYEVIRLYNGKPFTLAEHLERLRKSATAIQIPLPLAPELLASEIRKFIPKAYVRDGMVYLQLTRGVCPRNHLFPEGPCRPTLYFYARPLPPVPARGKAEGGRRWGGRAEGGKGGWSRGTGWRPKGLPKTEQAAKGAKE